LRDEAHRFAITAHRSRRSKSSIKSIFDEIKGIGPKRKKDLLLHFGTIQKIKSASVEELKQVKTIPSKKLEELYEFFNG
jgi:excinuclease ABC subunit C